MMKDLEDFNRLLIKNGLSKRGFGRKANICEAYAQQISRGQRSPSPRVAKQICDALGVEFDDIFFIVDARKSGQVPTGTEG
ncbi:MAG: XRE family transcriptional regulator [Sphaerochaeta sp.]|nr:MAG: XRE family transcriptional regulator [Sphaerochaeta sp.]